MVNLNPARKVVGIMKNFHFQSLSKSIGPLSAIIGDHNFQYNYIFMRVETNQLPNLIASLENTWKEINPKTDFEPSLLNENNDRMYRREKLMGTMFMSASSLAIFLSCMGLFGIAMFVISQRTKEIGIRKILGASVPSIVQLVSKDFLRTVVIGIVIASPIAWYVMNLWLTNYAYRIDIQWWVFLLAGILTVIIAFLTLSLQSIKAAISNPVDALRNE